MAHRDQTESQISRQRPDIPHSEPAGGTVSLEAAMMLGRSRVKRFFKLLGPGLITGASDDDPSGIRTSAVAAELARVAPAWTALLAVPFLMRALAPFPRSGTVRRLVRAAGLHR